MRRVDEVLIPASERSAWAGTRILSFMTIIPNLTPVDVACAWLVITHISYQLWPKMAIIEPPSSLEKLCTVCIWGPILVFVPGQIHNENGTFMPSDLPTCMRPNPDSAQCPEVDVMNATVIYEGVQQQRQATSWIKDLKGRENKETVQGPELNHEENANTHAVENL